MSWSAIMIFAWQQRLACSIRTFIFRCFSSLIADMLERGTARFSVFQFIRKLTCRPASRFLISSSKNKRKRRPLGFEVISALKVDISIRFCAVVINAIACGKNSLSINSMIDERVCHTRPNLFLYRCEVCDHEYDLSVNPVRQRNRVRRCVEFPVIQ